MRIAQLAPLAESVPPKLYGGTERVVAWLIDELVGLGHDVTLFASGDSRTEGKLHSVWPRALDAGIHLSGVRARLSGLHGVRLVRGRGLVVAGRTSVLGHGGRRGAPLGLHPQGAGPEGRG